MNDREQEQQDRRADWELRRRLADAALDKQREASRAEVEARAAEFAAAHGWDTSDVVITGPTTTELLQLYGSIEALSAASSDPAKVGGIRVVTIGELSQQRADEQSFYRRGGGRVPGQRGPAPRAPSTDRDSRFIRDALADGDTWA